MKEKTFNELIDEKMYHQEHSRLTNVGRKYMIELMQQVREATIAEFNKALKESTTLGLYKYEWKEIGNVLNNLPTDRIILTD